MNSIVQKDADGDRYSQDAYTLAELYELTQNVMSKEEFETKIQEKITEFKGLLDEHAAAYLVADELGLNTKPISTINKLYPGQEATLVVRVEEIYELRKFSRKNGREGLVQNIIVSDETGRCRAALWNEHAENQKLARGDVIKIINGFVKESRYGLEINVGIATLIERA